MMTEEEIRKYDLLVDEEIATKEEINLVRCVLAGSWDYILEAICYARTGYSIDGYLAEYELDE